MGGSTVVVFLLYILVNIFRIETHPNFLAAGRSLMFHTIELNQSGDPISGLMMPSDYILSISACRVAGYAQEPFLVDGWLILILQYTLFCTSRLEICLSCWKNPCTLVVLDVPSACLVSQLPLVCFVGLFLSLTVCCKRWVWVSGWIRISNLYSNIRNHFRTNIRIYSNIWGLICAS